MAPPEPATPSSVLARRIRAARKARGLTQDQWAALTSMTQATISAWERGLGMTGLDAMAHALQDGGMDPLILVGEEPGPLPDDEAELLALYRALSPEGRRFVLDFVKFKTGRRVN